MANTLLHDEHVRFLHLASWNAFPCVRNRDVDCTLLKQNDEEGCTECSNKHDEDRSMYDKLFSLFMFYVYVHMNCRLTSLSLKLNNLNTLPSCFSNLTSLHSLSLNYNLFNISNLPSSLFAVASTLEYLDLASQKLDVHAIQSNISSGIGQMTSLKYLSIRQDAFHGDLPSFLCNLLQLEELDLVGNKIHVIPACMSQLAHLHTINTFLVDFIASAEYFYSNASFASRQTIFTLDPFFYLQWNKIQFQNEVCSLERLYIFGALETELVNESAQISTTHFPEAFSNCSNLKEIYVSDWAYGREQLEREISWLMDQNFQLTQLTLDALNLTALPTSLSKHKHSMKTIKINRLSLELLPAFLEEFDSLESFVIARNRVPMTIAPSLCHYIQYNFTGTFIAPQCDLAADGCPCMYSCTSTVGYLQ